MRGKQKARLFDVLAILIRISPHYHRDFPQLRLTRRKNSWCYNGEADQQAEHKRWLERHCVTVIDEIF
jgi:hypothetical protein